MAVDRNDKGEKTVCSHLGTGERAPANIKEMFIHVAPLSIVLRNIYSFSLHLLTQAANQQRARRGPTLPVSKSTHLSSSEPTSTFRTGRPAGTLLQSPLKASWECPEWGLQSLLHLKHLQCFVTIKYSKESKQHLSTSTHRHCKHCCPYL